MKMKRTIAIAAAILALPALAADATWTGNATDDNEWSTSGNWNNYSDASGGSANFVFKNGGIKSVTFKEAETATPKDGVWIENGVGDANLVTWTADGDDYGLAIGTSDAKKTLTVGGTSGNGYLKMSRGAFSVTGNTLIGRTANKYGYLDIAGATLTTAGSFLLGGTDRGNVDSPTGIVAVTSGNLNINGFTAIGAATKSVGRLLIGGGTAAATVTIGSGVEFDLGRADGAVGEIKILENGTLSSPVDLRIGDYTAGSTGIVSISKGTLTATGKSLYLGGNAGSGAGGHGSFNIDDGSATFANLRIGNKPKSKGIVTASGGTITLSNAFFTGGDTSTYGEMNVSGCNVSAGATSYIGYGTSSTGTVNVSAGKLSVTSEVYLGYGSGSLGKLTVGNKGDMIVTSNLDIGRGQSNSSGACESAEVVVEKGGSLDVRGNIRLGFNNASKNCILTINGGEVFAATNANNDAGIQFGKDNGDSKGTLNLNGGVLTTRKVYRNNGTGVINFNGGTLKINSVNNNDNFFPNYDSVTANVCEGGAIIDTNGKTMGIAQPLLHGGKKAIDGGLTMLGSGTLNITGTPTFTGPVTVIGSGTLTLPNNSDPYVAGANTTITTNNNVITARRTAALDSSYSIPAYSDDANGRIMVPNTWDGIDGYFGSTATEADRIEAILALQNGEFVDAANGYSYAWCYGLGLATNEANAKPKLKAETAANGSITLSYDGTMQGGVTAKVRSSTDNETWGEATSTMTITPSSDLSDGSVKYYKLEFSVP